MQKLMEDQAGEHEGLAGWDDGARWRGWDKAGGLGQGERKQVRPAGFPLWLSLCAHVALPQSWPFFREAKFS